MNTTDRRACERGFSLHERLDDRKIVVRAIVESFVKLNPRSQARNPVMFTVEVAALAVLIFWLRDLFLAGGHNAGFDFAISAWLWFTVLFANFAEAVAEGRGKAQADYLRRTKSDAQARRIRDGREELVSASLLRKDDTVRIDAGELIPGDGEVIEGAATVDESAITGESAPVVREAAGDRSAVTGGTRGLLRQHRRAHQLEPRRYVPRSHDRARRRRQTPKDSK